MGKYQNRNLKIFSRNWTNIIMTSDSLNEGLPIKMVKEKFQRKCYIFLEKDCNFNSRIIRTNVFRMGQVHIKNMGRKHCFFLFNI